MADRSAIEWTDASWNPVVGCSLVSPGCTNCYAMRVAWRLQHLEKFAGLAKIANGRPVWTGAVRLDEKALDQPLRWRTPRRIFVNSMSDLFHEAIDIRWIDRIFAMMAEASWHDFQVLTKRPRILRDYLLDSEARDRIDRAACERRGWHGQWPLPNVQLGVSVERQQEADERIPLLLDTPAAVRFISAEPLLGPIDLNRLEVIGGPHLDWVIVGGESGPNARPMHPDWARSLRDQCQAAGVPFFFKQWGEWDWIEDKTYEAAARLAGKRPFEHHICGRTAVREGKRRIGRLLDGREWNEFPRLAAVYKRAMAGDPA